jgi:carbon-monoxide dehydrogenase medium subunit
VTPFAYHDATTIEEATELLEREPDSHLIAGGTAIILLIKQGLIRPTRLIGLRRIADLHGMATMADGGLWIGAMTSHSEIAMSPLVRGHCQALADTFASVATVRIRNQATIGGNLVHADPAQDPPPMLMALGAEVVMRGPRGERRLSLDAFFIDMLETALEPDEIVVAIRLPPISRATSASYMKFLPNSKSDYATVSVGVALEVDADQRCVDVRIALAGAGPTPLRARSVEAALSGQVLTPALISEAADRVVEDIDPLDDMRGSAGYKREMASVWVERALRGLAAGGSRSGANGVDRSATA